MNVSLIKGFSDNWKFSGNAQSWSITCELTFYSLFPLFLWLQRRIRYPLFFFLMISYLMGVLLYAWGPKAMGVDWFGSWFFVSGYTYFGRALEFVIGILFGLQAREKLAEQREVMSRPPLYTMFGATMTLLFVIWLSILGERSPSKISFFLPQGNAIALYALPFGLGSLIYGLAMESSLLQRVLSFRLLNMLGKASYAFYLLHLGPLQFFGQLIGVPLHAWQYYIFVQLVALVVYVGWEAPMHRAIRSGNAFCGRARAKRRG